MKLKLFFSLAVFLIAVSINIPAQVNTEKFMQDADTTGFTGMVDFEGTAITGNTDFQLIGVGGRLNYNFGDDYTFLVGDAGFGWEGRESFSNQALAHLRHVVTTGKLLQLEFFSQFDYNKDRLLLERELLGTGIRLRLISSDSFKFRYGIAYMFENEVYDLPAISLHGKNSSSHRISSYFTFSFMLQENLNFVSVTYFQPDIKEINDYKLISENALVVILGKLVDLNIKFNLRHDSRPPDTIKETDTISKVGLSFKF